MSDHTGGERGVVMSVASFNGAGDTMCWAGVGNVEGTLKLGSGDLLLLVTDGVRSGFREGLCVTDSTDRIAGSIIESHAKETDDALALVVRYLGWM